MKIIFFGTPEYVVPILEALHKTYNQGRDRELIGVVTQSPKPVGREKQLEYSPVDHFAHKHKIPLYFDFSELPEADLGICVAYGKIIPEETIASFPLGILNIHPSLLPSLRGASPIQATLVEGSEQTGVTVIKMDSEMDHGDIVSSFKSDINMDDTNETLRARLFTETIDFLLPLISAYSAGKVNLKEQDHKKATYTKSIKKEDGFISGKFLEMAMNGETTTEEISVRFMNEKTFTPDAKFIERFMRAFTPWPGLFTKISIGDQEKRLKIVKLHLENEKLVIDEVQLEGKNPVSFEQFREGHKDFSFIQM